MSTTLTIAKTPGTQQALRALRDVTVVRAPFDHPGYAELSRLGLAEGRYVRQNLNLLDFRLTRRGHYIASRAFV